jgi:hypothetical protein
MTEMAPFDPNGYRKRVLAAVEKRGGPAGSDPFELYDLPPDDDLDDAAVAARVEEVWGFWQRQRDHPKYRVLAAVLVAGHAERSAELLDPGRRRTAAARVRAAREQRDAARFELLDAAISRLVQRYGGVPRDKMAGLDEVGALVGLTPDEVAARLRRHRVVEPAPVPPGIDAERRGQIRALLAEFGRLTDVTAPPTLLALVGLEPSASDEQVRAAAGAWRSRARELPAERLRSVVDELMVHVGELLEPGRAAVEAYLDSVAVDVAEHLRPRVRAAVLVEDRLVAADHAHLLEEAVALGLDRRRATAVLAGLAAELQAPIETADAPEPSPPPPPPPRRDRAWEDALKRARAALRAGRPVEARGHVEDAAESAGTDGATPVRAVADEIDAVLAEAEVRQRAASAALAVRHWAEALEHLEHLHRVASDLPGRGDPAVARREVERADTAVAAALAGPEVDRAAALLAVLDAAPDHPAAVAALAEVPLRAPEWVSAARDARGDVVVLWPAASGDGVTYRVRRLRPDGSWDVVGRVPDTSIQDGGAPPGVEAPVYAVSALLAGRRSTETRSDSVPARPGAAPADVPAPPRDVRAVRVPGGSVRVSWTGVGDVDYRVRCVDHAGCWRVVGRTRDTSIEDGGAPDGPPLIYAVSAGAGGTRSDEAFSTDR